MHSFNFEEIQHVKIHPDNAATIFLLNKPPTRVTDSKLESFLCNYRIWMQANKPARERFIDGVDNFIGAEYSYTKEKAAIVAGMKNKEARMSRVVSQDTMFLLSSMTKNAENINSLTKDYAAFSKKILEALNNMAIENKNDFSDEDLRAIEYIFKRIKTIAEISNEIDGRVVELANKFFTL